MPGFVEIFNVAANKVHRTKAFITMLVVKKIVLSLGERMMIID